MDLYDTLELVRNIIYSVVLFLALSYSSLILCIRRFHHQNNIFILNICVNTITAVVYWIIYFYAVAYDMSPSMCILFQYAFNIASVQIPFAFVAFTVHRLCIIVYYRKPWFKTKQWVAICISTQWVASFLISLPFVFEEYDDCTGNTVRMGVYTVVTSIIIPSTMNIVLNMCIFLYVRKSSRRIQAQMVSSMASEGNQQQSRVSRRDITLLKQMIFTFTMFIVGWTPAFVINTLNTTIYVDFKISMASVFLSSICLVALMINLFIYNHDVRQYIWNGIQRCFPCLH